MDGLHRIYAIADLHGELSLLNKALVRIEEHSAAHGVPSGVVFLGDYVDRGPDSHGVVARIKSLLEEDPARFFAVAGNHEQMMVQAVMATIEERDGVGLDLWLKHGGQETLDSYKTHPGALSEHIEWMKNLPTNVQTENHIFVHAGVHPDKTLDEQEMEDFLWLRGWESFPQKHEKHIVYGHSARKKPLLLSHCSGLDTGACWTGNLTVGLFDLKTRAGPQELLFIR